METAATFAVVDYDRHFRPSAHRLPVILTTGSPVKIARTPTPGVDKLAISSPFPHRARLRSGTVPPGQTNAIFPLLEFSCFSDRSLSPAVTDIRSTLFAGLLPHHRTRAHLRTFADGVSRGFVPNTCRRRVRRTRLHRRRSPTAVVTSSYCSKRATVVPVPYSRIFLLST